MVAERRLWTAVRSMRDTTSTATPSGISSDSASSTLLASILAPASISHSSRDCMLYDFALSIAANCSVRTVNLSLATIAASTRAGAQSIVNLQK